MRVYRVCNLIFNYYRTYYNETLEYVGTELWVPFLLNYFCVKSDRFGTLESP